VVETHFIPWARLGSLYPFPGALRSAADHVEACSDDPIKPFAVHKESCRRTNIAPRWNLGVREATVLAHRAS
jgi:hypothetical protein